MRVMTLQFSAERRDKGSYFQSSYHVESGLENDGRDLRFTVCQCGESTAFSNGSTYSERTFQTMTFRCLIHFFFTGASLCRCITFPGHLLTSKDGETAPDGHNY